ncbi:poly-gamma-glutamate hydrolase family protein [Mesorhizobium sp. WSM4884]|uniref:poly-gamma-glutamate hydrolase family protein n=1 Tax=Mesorhizobium sp. WSM4884 TaxID=3038542 RepID=UPI0024173562|nr:poly-gamma-glutamate hydrolase family protein [Mesorhizobium sp. WSM4884]MDG4884066.1 poly-gamma-glutamate hydrolase family protein [Mesorhizobium sp. WSM4884]
MKAAKIENIDYRIVVRRGGRTGSAIVMAPHGGKIEPRTSLITETIAGRDLDMYCFEGLMPESNRELHITSRNFDEESALELLRTKSTVVAIHGRQDRHDPSTVYLGGKDVALVSVIAWRLQEADFQAKKDNHPFPGIQDSNIVNRGLRGKGAQLEVPLSLRRRLGSEPELLERFCGAVRKAIVTFDAENGAQSSIVF